MKRITKILTVALLLTPVMASASPHEGTAVSADGSAIHFSVVGSGSPALIFIHGWSMDGGYWSAQMNAFAGLHQVVAIDLAGHGASSVEREAWTIEAFADDVVAVMETLEIEDAVLIGHSMGGAVMVETALAAPHRVRGLVGVDNFQTATLALPDGQIEALVGAFEENFVAMAQALVGQIFTAGSDPDLRDEVVADIAAAPPKIAIPVFANTLRWYDHRAAEALALLDVPLNSINSDLAPTDVEALAALVPGYQLRVMEGRGHFLMLEDPAGFNRELKSLVQGMAGR